MDKFSALKYYYGYDTFKEGQAEVIDQLLDGRDALCIMPTGAGKSVCYQIPALLQSGTTIVVSPLISLMKDQVNTLLQMDISAAYINSSLSLQEYRETLREMKQKWIPDRLCGSRETSFRSFFKSVLADTDPVSGGRRSALYFSMGSGFST